MTEQVVIIGAPRSGTNILRDFLCSVPGLATWPCDEINYIWRYGNASFSSDVLTPDMVTDRTRKYVRRQFDWVSRRYDARIVVEKTCANSLRVTFVDRVLDSPRYVFIVRDGYDASFSAMKRWRARLDLPYLAKKVRFVPPSDLPLYAMRYLASRAARLLSDEKRLSTWGPRLPDMAELAGKLPLEALCAMQWKECVERSLDAFEAIDETRVLRVRYESLATCARDEARRLGDFLGIDTDDLLKSPLLAEIRPDSIGSASKGLGDEAMSRMQDVLGPTMQRLGYT